MNRTCRRAGIPPPFKRLPWLTRTCYHPTRPHRAIVPMRPAHPSRARRVGATALPCLAALTRQGLAAPKENPAIVGGVSYVRYTAGS